MLSNLRSRVNTPRPILKSRAVKSPLHESFTFVLDSDSESSDDSDHYVKPKSALSVKFALHAPPSPIPRVQSKADIEKALAFLPCPLSPYPRLGKDKKPSQQGKENSPKRALRREAKHAASLAAPAPQGRTVAPRRVLRRPAELNLAAPLMGPPGLGPALSSVPESPVGVPLDVTASITASPSEGSSELSAAFWRAVTVEDAPSSPGPASPFLFGRKDGSLWSPGLPRRARASSTDLLLRSIFSPRPQLVAPAPLAAPALDVATHFAGLTSPAPCDPIAGFASFTTALSVERHFAALTSPAPHDPAAGFASFSAALAALGTDPVITFPPGVARRGGRAL